MGAFQGIKSKFLDEVLAIDSCREVNGQKVWDSKGQGWEKYNLPEGGNLDKPHLQREVSSYLKGHDFSRSKQPGAARG